MLVHVALNGEAQFLITGDQDLRVLDSGFHKSYGLRILSPAETLALD